MKKLGIVGILLLLIWGCERHPPEINEIYWQLNYFQDLERGEVVPEMLLYLDALDEDGQEDLESILVFSDQEELYWRLDSSNWQETTQDGAVWIGSSALVGEGELPRGEYRIVLQDVSGARSEKIISVGDDRIAMKFPVVDYGENTIKVTGLGRTYVLWFYDESGHFLKQLEIGNKEEMNIREELFNKQNIRIDVTFEVYWFDPVQATGFQVGPFYLKRNPSSVSTH